MAVKSSLFAATIKVPDAESAVVSCRNSERVFTSNDDMINASRMSLEPMQLFARVKVADAHVTIPRG